MEDTKKIKTIFEVSVSSIISDTDDPKVGEANTGYTYDLNTSLPELAYTIAGFLKQLDLDEDISKTVEGTTVGEAFITLLNQYYISKEV